MRVWFHPADEPGIYAVDRTDPDNPIIVISEGLPMEQVVACAAHLATVEERNWVRAQLGYPPIEKDPTYTVADCHTGGKPTWDSSMIPDELLWPGPNPCEKASGGVGVALVWWAAAASIVGAVASVINGDSGLFTSNLL